LTKNISVRSNDELKKMVKKATEARKIVRKEMDALFSKGWELKRGKYKLDWLIWESKKELGRRRADRCGALITIKDEWSRTFFSCGARELSFNRFGTDSDLYRKHCCTCRWKPSQAKTRMVILRIKNGRKS